jgi:hypothetical protein
MEQAVAWLTLGGLLLLYTTIIVWTVRARRAR